MANRGAIREFGHAMGRSNMNILYCDPLATKNEVYCQVHVYEVLNNLSKLGHNVVPLRRETPRDGDGGDTGQSGSSWERTKKRLRSLPIYKPLKGEIYILWMLLSEIRTFLSAFRLIMGRRENFDVIYRRHHLYNSEYLLGKLFGIPSVREMNGIVADEARITGRGDSFSLRVIDWIERSGIRKADRIIVVTPRMKELLENDYRVPGNGIVVVENGANTDMFRPMSTTEAQKALDLDPRHRYVCFVGSLSQWQGVDYLIRAAPAVLEKVPATCFLIVGDGVMKDELTMLAEQLGVSDNVVFVGRAPYQRVPLYINASDVCSVPKTVTRVGYSPLKLHEYMACGRPVVATRTKGFEVLEEKRAGLLVDPENPEDLADAIAELLGNPQRAKHMGESGREYVLENRSWESVARRVAEVCRQTLLDHRARRTGGRT